MPHTKGPWHEGQGNGEGHIFADEGRMRLEAGGTTLYPVATVDYGWEMSEDAANARLIAAAPELLLAAKIGEYVLANAKAVLGDWDSVDEVRLQKIRDAIAKAEGR